VVQDLPNPSQPEPAPGEATILLDRITDGDSTAAEDLLPLVYAELRARAVAYFRGQPSNHTLQPTALVHEAYVKLVNSPTDQWKSRSHFCAVAATAMRQILVDHARKRAAAKRAKDAHDEMVTDLLSPSKNTTVNLLALDDALEKLADLDPRQARLIELRFFGGLSNSEVGGILELSTSTIEKDWRKIRAWLLKEINEKASS